jgi:hypothetical protein
MSFNFIPQDYVAPTPSGGEFLRLPEDGKSIRFIPLSTLVSGYTYWDDAKNSYRSPVEFTDTPGLREGEKPKHFWMFHVLDLDELTIKIIEITQVSVQRDIISQIELKDYNFMNGTYGFRVTRKGKGKNDTKYTTTPTPVKTGDERSKVDTIIKVTPPTAEEVIACTKANLPVPEPFIEVLVELSDLTKFAFDKREPKSDVTEVVPDVM